MKMTGLVGTVNKVTNKYVNWCNEQHEDRRLIRRNNVIVGLGTAVMFGALGYVGAKKQIDILKERIKYLDELSNNYRESWKSEYMKSRRLERKLVDKINREDELELKIGRLEQGEQNDYI